MPDLWLLFAPIKRGRIDWLVEKATELGVARLVPVAHPAHRSSTGSTSSGCAPTRSRRPSNASAPRCPSSPSRVKLDALLADWPADRTLYFADEAGGAPLADGAAPGPAAILIGPEGGFTDEERAAIRALPQARPVSLGPRILRADTAAVAAVSAVDGGGGRLGATRRSVADRNRLAAPRPRR